MKYLFLISLFVLQIVNLLSQSAEMNGKLNTGELLTGNYSGGFSFGTTYLWTTTNDVSGTDNLKEVGTSETYRLKDSDAGKYIRVAITVTSFWGRKETYYSERKGPVRYSAPVITGTVTISGTLKTGNTITANYVYDPNNYPESGSTFRWYIADNSTGANAILVSSSGSSFQLLDNQESKYIRVEVTPRDVNGATGANYSSSWYGPIEKTQQINLAPIATNVRISGNPVYCSVLTGLYDYNDTELDPEGGSSFRWLRGAASGGSPTPISSATAKTYTVTTADKGMYLYFEVTPKASSGTTNGAPVLSNPTSLIQGDLPTVTFTGNASICEGSSTTITLTFTGNPPFNLDYTNGDRNFNLSTSNYTYQLSVNAGGTYKGTRLTDILNCPVTNLPSSAVINMKASPSPDFSIGNACYTGDSTVFVNTSNPKSSITKWIWNFGDATAPAAQNTSAVEAPKHKYPAAGTYSVWLAAENTEGCRDTIFKNIVLGAKPGIDLSWDKECFSSGISVNFTNGVTNAEKISKYSWILQSAGKTLRESITSNLNYIFSAAGSFDVKLKLTTEAGCADSSSKVFTLKPQVKLTDSSYSENFEGGIKNWFVELKSNNNWTWGTPKGTAINSAHSGTGALYTTFPEARQNLQLSISSPCFDFTNLQKPFIDLWVNYASAEAKEGAVVQFARDGETAWTTLGTVNTGLNWYNSNNIQSQPGRQAIGWSGNSGGWKQARYSLAQVANKNNIRFRVIYATAAGAPTSEGFAFDDVFIGERGKKVLVEHFTNLSDAFATRSNISFDSVMNAAGTNAIGIQYHTSFPGIDSLNEDNKANPAARALYYGVGKVPLTYLDGGWNQNYIYDFSTKKLTTNDVIYRVFDDPKFKLSIVPAIQDNTLSGTVTTSALSAISNIDMTLYIAIVEDIDITLSGKPVTFRNVLKYIYPSSAGTLLSRNWAKNQSTEVNYTWLPVNVYNSAKLKTIAFIQNNSTREIYQVEMVTSGAVTSDDEIAVNHEGLVLYPNPASEQVTLEFGAELTSDMHIQIITPSGKTLNEWLAPKGANRIDLPVNTYPTGLYFIKMTTSDNKTTMRKLVVKY